MRGIRGAITVDKNEADAIRTAARELTQEMVDLNNVSPEDVGALIFTATEDITAAFPASGARRIPGFEFVPLFDARQMAVDDGLPMCIRALMLVDTDKKQRDIRHVYLGGAAALRPDIIAKL